MAFRLHCGVFSYFAQFFCMEWAQFVGNLCTDHDGSGDPAYGELPDMFDVYA